MKQDFLYSAKYDFPSSEGKPRKTIALLFMPRSGSTLLACLMAQTKRLGFPLEYFSSHNMATLSQRLEGLDPENLEALIKVRTSSNGVFSYKWNYDFESLHGVSGINKTLKPDYYLVMDRDDKYAQAKSLALATKTNQWVLPKVHDSKGVPVAVDEHEIESAARLLREGKDRLYSIISTHPAPYMEITYEALLEDVQGTINRIAEFCGESIDMHVSLADVPINKQGSVDESIENIKINNEIMISGPEEYNSRRVFIATHHLENYAGTEIVSLELATEFVRRGWKVTVGSFIVGKPIMEDFRRAGIKIKNLFDEAPQDVEYDLIWVCHRPVYEYLFGKLGLRARRVLFASHSPYESLEALPEDSSAIDLVIANSVETRDGILAEPRLALPPLAVFGNFAPESFFSHPAPTIERLRRLAVVSNHPPEEVLAARPLFEAAGIGMDIIGLGHVPRRVTPELLASYDLVVSIGKTVQYCLALGLPVYCYDRFGGPGWIQAADVPRLEQVNYSGRGDIQRSTEDLYRDVVSGFAGALLELEPLRDLARERYRLSLNLDRLLGDLDRLPARPATARRIYSRANDYYLSELRGRLYLAHVNRVNEHVKDELGAVRADLERMRLNLAKARRQAMQLKQHLEATADSLAEREQLVFRISKLLTEDVQYLASIRQAVQGGKKPLLTQAVNKATDDKRLAGMVEVLQQVQEIVRGKKQEREARALEGLDPAAVDQAAGDLAIGIMAHVYYVDLFGEIRDLLAGFPYPYTLLVSVVDQAAAAAVREQAASMTNLKRLEVRVVPNRGRDLAPFFVAFRDEIRVLDLVCHIHTKKSLYTGTERTGWRQYLYQGLLGGAERVQAIVRQFAAFPAIGLVYPESYAGMPFWGHTWLQNKPIAMMLAQRLGYAIDLGEYLDYPAGSMFWARTKALKPLFDLNLVLDNFPEEAGQTDGTLQHALERYLGIAPGLCGYQLRVIAADGSFMPAGEKNWQHYFAAPLATKLEAAAARAGIVSVDVFDTLIQRPFLHPDVVFDFIGEFLQARHGLANFKALRKKAEAKARSDKGGRDVGLDEIYACLRAHLDGNDALAEEIKEIEQGMELWFTRPRTELIRLLQRLSGRGMRIVAVSDMYLPKALIRQMLDHVGADFIDTVYLSNETGFRKDTGEAWRRLPALEGVAAGAWLHIGDNEHSDIQLPVDANYLPPLHILRPAAMLETVPCLRALHRREFLAWPDQLWLGLVANRFADLADRFPASFGKSLRLEDLDTIGYVCFGPVVVNYILWLARRAVREGRNHLLFLSREGYLLEKVFGAIRQAVPALAGATSSYFLTSRRASGVAAMRSQEDLAYLLGAHFKGRLSELIQARFGSDMLQAFEAAGDLDLDQSVVLPEMKEKLLSGMLASRAHILAIAEQEREAYLEYWRAEVPEGPVALCDLGFSGTIQKFLMAMTGSKLDGYYFVTTSKVEGLKKLGVGVHGLYGESVSQDGVDVPAFDYSLILESVLTAPAGQFQHFARDGAALRPVFKAAGHGQAHFDKIAKIQQGILNFVADLVAAVGERIFDAEFNKEMVQTPLRLLVDGTWSMGANEQLFSVEDDFSGLGEISCIEHYRRIGKR